METTTNEEQNSGQHQEAQEESQSQPLRVLVPPKEVFKKQQEFEQQYLETIAKMNK